LIELYFIIRDLI